MVEVIYDLKNQLLEQLEKDVQERGADRLDKDKVDMVKDLAEAEKSCWEAEYYRSVAEAMGEGSGYDGAGAAQMGYNGMSGAQQDARAGSSASGRKNGTQGRSGWANQYGSGYSRRGYGMRGYRQHMDALRMEMQNADPQQREQIIQELRGMMQ